jgi:hypothetical protein
MSALSIEAGSWRLAVLQAGWFFSQRHWWSIERLKLALRESYAIDAISESGARAMNSPKRH